MIDRKIVNMTHVKQKNILKAKSENIANKRCRAVKLAAKRF